MAIIIDHQLKEYIPHNAIKFPITYFHDELVALPDRVGPLHWHPDFEIATAECGVLDYQVDDQHIILEAGDSIFVNGNILHGIKQVSGEQADPMPNIVFSGTLIAPEASTIYQKYIRPVIQCNTLPFIIFRHNDCSLGEINCLINDIYRHMSKKTKCYELVVQRNISRIFEFISNNTYDMCRCIRSNYDSMDIGIYRICSWNIKNYWRFGRTVFICNVYGYIPYVVREVQ